MTFSYLLLLLFLPLCLAASTSGGGTCRGVLECNGRLCYDCSCQNNKCECGSGFSGPNCDVPFCNNRTDGCSGHGDCRSTIHNISCECDYGYAGAHCETKTCTLQCHHGGTPYADCSKCDGCKGAWGGKLCDVWNGDANPKELMQKLDQIANASQTMLDAQRHFNPICRQGHECVGWGVDGATGRPTAFPIVYLSYDPSRTDKQFNGMAEPVEVVANHVVKPTWAFIDGGNAFPRIEDYEQHVNTQYAGASPVPKGTNGIYSSSIEDVFDAHFQKKDDRAMSVARASLSLISMSLPTDPVTKTRQYRIDRHASDFANSLPPRYDTEDNKAQFRYFIEKYGTSFAVSATLGGLVEQYSSWKTWLADPRLEGGGLSKDDLVRNAQIDFARATGLTGPSTQHNEEYNKDTVNVSPLSCLGGDPTVSCEASFGKWAKTIQGSPVLLDYELAPISDLVEDPDVKAALDEAVKEYLAEKAGAWSAVDKCPLNCGISGAGKCQKGQSSCTCAYPGVIGRQCTGCAPVSVRATFRPLNTKKTTSSVSTLGCNSGMQTVYSGDGGMCTTPFATVNRQSKYCECSVRGSYVQCSRNSIGNLKVQVHQPGCSCTCSSVPSRQCSCSAVDGKGSKPTSDKIDQGSSSVTLSQGIRVDKKIEAKCEFA